jgi:hypothetical protein
MANTRILYLECDKQDVAEKFLASKPNYFMRLEDGRIDYPRRMAWDGPWIYTKAPRWQNCHLWHRIYFDILFGKTMVPSGCQSCWKVVIEPRTLEELVATYFLQQNLGRPSKCGTETERENTSKLYGGYWYNHSLEEGQECYEAVVKAITEIEAFQRVVLGCPIKVRFNKDPLPPIILKRGCTEFEQHVGPSDKWQVSEEQAEKEEIYNGIFVDERIHPAQPDHVLAHVLKGWIHNAYKVGDESYKLFTNGNELFAQLVTYHHQQAQGGKKDG